MGVETLIWLPNFIQPIADFLNVVLVDKYWIFLSVWSIIHFLMGGIIYYLLRRYEVKMPMLATLSILVLFEFFELFLMYVPKLIYPEKLVDTLWDLILGQFSAVMVWLYLDHK